MLFSIMLIDTEENRSKMELIYELYHNYMAMEFLSNRSDAEDAVQEAFYVSSDFWME